MTSLDPTRTNRWITAAAEIVVPARREDVVIEAQDDEVVFCDPANGRTHHLNATARQVWESCDGTMTTRDIAARLTGRYDVPLERALEDVEQTVVVFAEAGLLGKVGAS